LRGPHDGSLWFACSSENQQSIIDDGAFEFKRILKARPGPSLVLPKRCGRLGARKLVVELAPLTTGDPVLQPQTPDDVRMVASYGNIATGTLFEFQYF
jgi:hypothetical protein